MPKRKGKRHTKKEHTIQSAIAKRGGRSARNSWAITMSQSPKARGRRTKKR
jgi:hypothetical protein